MQLRITKLLILLLINLSFYAKAQTVKDYAVLARAVVTKSPPSISLRWPKITTGITRYNIYRKAKDASTWGTFKGTVLASDTMWTDTTVKVGVLYEYNIQKMNSSALVGVSYMLCGIEVPEVHSRGNVLVLTEKTLNDSIQSDIDNYLKDLAADGWKVYTTMVKRTDSVQTVRREIRKMDALSGGLRSLVILGHVPVPYSGNFGQDAYYTVPPDGHTPDHNGAWPTDAYYTIDSEGWTDNETNINGITRAENKNMPGDSKWDNIEFPGTVKYQSGRIDLFNMPKFGKTEVALIKNYLRKNHEFRFKLTATVEKSVIDENFSASTGAFSSTGWRNFSAMFGPSNIIEGDYFTNCRKQNLLFGFGSGGGSYTSCGGVGNTDSFVLSKPAVFNMLFGSYFGDWDVANSFLRAPLAAAENGLTNAWSGRPWWQNHPLAIGETFGYCTMLTQNNPGKGQGLYADNVFGGTIPVGLMGDPTLRLHMITPPANVNAKAASNNTKVNLTWTASGDPAVIGYYIYRSANPLSNNFPINKTPVTGTSFTDNTPYQGTNHYLVKAVRLTTSASGSYFNLSHGIATSIAGITGATANIEKAKISQFKVYPNPGKDEIRIQFTSNPDKSEIELYDLQGKLLKRVTAQLNSDLLSQSINIEDLSEGVYLIKTGNSAVRFIKN